MKLFRLCAPNLRLSEPLPWNVYNDSGQLLLSAGHQLEDEAQLQALVRRGVYADEVAYATHEAHRARRIGADPFALWVDIHERAHGLLTRELDPLSFAHDIDQTAASICRAIDEQLDHSLFDVLHADDPAGYVVSHSVQTAFVCGLIATRLGWGSNERQMLTNSALTMNLGMRELQATLARQTHALSPTQRQQVDQHARRSREMLEANGVTDADWLRAVEQHHVTPDGSGLPAHHHQLSETACMLHYSDVYLAKISARATRPAIAAHQAARALYLQADGARNPYVAAIIKEVGIYPPGSCVRLSNGETAMVIKRGEAAHMPLVGSLRDSRGQALPEPVIRQTSQAAFKIVDALPRGHIQLSVAERRAYARAV